MVSPYLQLPLRTLEQAQADTQGYRLRRVSDRVFVVFDRSARKIAGTVTLVWPHIDSYCSGRLRGRDHLHAAGYDIREVARAVLEGGRKDRTGRVAYWGRGYDYTRGAAR